MKKKLLRLIYALVVRMGKKDYNDNVGIYHVTWDLLCLHASYMDDGEYGTSTLDLMCPCCGHVLKGYMVKEVVTDPLARYS